MAMLNNQMVIINEQNENVGLDSHPTLQFPGCRMPSRFPKVSSRFVTPEVLVETWESGEIISNIMEELCFDCFVHGFFLFSFFGHLRTIGIHSISSLFGSIRVVLWTLFLCFPSLLRTATQFQRTLTMRRPSVKKP